MVEDVHTKSMKKIYLLCANWEWRQKINLNFFLCSQALFPEFLIRNPIRFKKYKMSMSSA